MEGAAGAHLIHAWNAVTTFTEVIPEAVVACNIAAAVAFEDCVLCCTRQDS